MASEAVDITSEYDAADHVSAEELPIIDLGGALTGNEAERARVVAEVGAACREIGFFYLTGHAIEQYLIDATFEQVRAYFAQPFETKMRLLATPEHYRGYFPPRRVTERADVMGGSMEAFRLMLDLPAHDPEVLAGTPLYGANRWPSQLPSFRVVLEQFEAATMALAAELRAIFALALGLDADAFERWFTKPLINLQPAHYGGQPSLETGRRQVGVGEHRDTGGFTLLMQDDIPGLEVRDRSGRWIEAPIIPGAFIVNIGDSMMAWTNGEFVSTPHRVVNRSTNDRYIVALFMNPDFHCVVEPLSPFVSASRPAQFAPVHNGEYWQALAASANAY